MSAFADGTTRVLGEFGDHSTFGVGEGDRERITTQPSEQITRPHEG